MKRSLARAKRMIMVMCICAVALGVGFLSLLVVTLTFTSDARISAQLRRAEEKGILVPEAYPVSPYGHSGHSFDMYTECIALGTNLGNGEDSLMRRVAASPFIVELTSNGEWKGDPCVMLVGAIETNQVKAAFPYLRFWHGYQTYIRSMLSVMSLENMRRVTAVIFYGVLIFFTYNLAQLCGPWAWPVMLLPFFTVGDFLVVPILTSHAIPLIWIFATAALVLGVLERFDEARERVLPVLVFCAGAITNFLSFLFNPPLAPALIAFLVIAKETGQATNQTWRTLAYAGWLSALWFAGFAVAWVQKWIVAALVLGPETVAGELSGTFNKYEIIGASERLGFLGATWHNLAINWLFFGYIVASVALAGMILVLAFKMRGAGKKQFVDFVAMMAPLLLIVVWVEANSAHSAQHNGFVSRSFLLFSVIPLLAALLVWRRTSVFSRSRDPVQTPAG